MPGAEIILLRNGDASKDKEESVGTRDATIEVSKRDSPVIIVHKDGCEDGRAVVKKTFDGVSLLGLLIDFGLISILVVDVAATGAVNKLETAVKVNPHCDDAHRSASSNPSQPSVTAPVKDSSICRRAFQGVEDLANAWIEWHPGADPQDALPERDAFTSVCGELPEEVQLCLTLKYARAHHDECMKNFDELPARTKARLQRLFVRPHEK